MLEYRAEGLCRNANTLTHEEWERCIAAGEVLQSTALAYDTDRCLRFEIAGHRARMPFAGAWTPPPARRSRILRC